MSGVLDGIRVLDFGRFIAGPFCAALLADHGADVIRIDKIGGSEDRHVLPLAETGEGGLYLQMNRGKRSLTLDTGRVEAREVVRRLAARADIVVANMPEATLRSMQIDYGSLSSVNPRLILVATDAFGRAEPVAHRVGFDGVGQAISSAAWMTGEGDAPRRAAVNYVDFGTAAFAAFGALLALIARERTGLGQEVTGSLAATALTIANSVLIEQAVARPDRIPQGNLGYSSAPADLFRCGDGSWLIVQTVGQPLWERFCRMLGETEWPKDPRFADDTSRGRHARVVSSRLGEWCAARSRDDALRELEAARIPAAPVHNPQGTLDDASLRAAGFFRQVAFPGMPATAPLVETPVGLSRSPGSIRGRAPLLSEHTDEILREIGYTEGEIRALREARVV